jgi:hypothetical protein
MALVIAVESVIFTFVGLAIAIMVLIWRLYKEKNERDVLIMAANRPPSYAPVQGGMQPEGYTQPQDPYGQYAPPGANVYPPQYSEQNKQNALQIYQQNKSNNFGAHR